MDQNLAAEGAQRFSKAADALIAACRTLESAGLDDPPVDRLMRALDEVTEHVHRMHPPDDRPMFEPADAATQTCRIAAREADE